MNLKTMSPGQAILQHRRQYYHQCGTTEVEAGQKTGQTTYLNQENAMESVDYVFEYYTIHNSDLKQ
jgi:hypothetical protein